MSGLLRYGWLLGALGLACTERVVVDVEGAGAVAGVEEGNAGAVAAAGAAGAAATYPGFACSPDEFRCEGECVPLGHYTVCEDECVPLGYDTVCEDECVNLMSDGNNCGACGVRCTSASDVGCIGGLCKCLDDNRVYCDGFCVYLSGNAANCGACGHACSLSASCADGACQCPSGVTHECSGECVTLESDAKNCGACSNECSSARRESCVNGVCQCGGWKPADCGGLCVDTAVDPQHCGACGAVCPLDQPYCDDGVCSEIGRFDALADFRDATNPNGVWSYGWAPTPTGPFELYQVLLPPSETAFMPDLYTGTGIWRNTSSTEDLYGVPPLSLAMNPGVIRPALVSVVRWTAPRAATCDVDGRFLDVVGMSAGMPGLVVVDGAIVFTACIT